MRSTLSISLLFCFITGFSQYKPRNVLEKEFFMHTWKLVEVRIGNTVSKPSVNKSILFTKDSVFVTSGNKDYSGTWTLKKSQLYIIIPNTSAYNYKWVNIGQGVMCLRIGNDFSTIECFRRE